MRIKTTHMIMLAGLLIVPLSEAAPATAGGENDKIFETAASACEDLIEDLGTADQALKAKRLRELQQSVGALPGLSAPDRKVLQDRVAAIVAADPSRQTETGLEIVELYRTVVDAAGWTAPKTPKRVALLDYAGYKLSILSEAKSIDWEAVAATSTEAATVWKSLQSRVADKAKAELGDVIMTGLEDNVGRRDEHGLANSAHLILAAVDIFEQELAGQK